jgi:hypothetical protein
MHPPGWHYTPVTEIMAVAMAEEDMDARILNTDAAKWTIITPKHAERE